MLFLRGLRIKRGDPGKLYTFSLVGFYLRWLASREGKGAHPGVLSYLLLFFTHQDLRVAGATGNFCFGTFWVHCYSAHANRTTPTSGFVRHRKGKSNPVGATWSAGLAEGKSSPRHAARASTHLGTWGRGVGALGVPFFLPCYIIHPYSGGETEGA